MTEHTRIKDEKIYDSQLEAIDSYHSNSAVLSNTKNASAKRSSILLELNRPNEGRGKDRPSSTEGEGAESIQTRGNHRIGLY